MPRPPLLPTIDYRATFSAAKPWSEWIKIAEDPANIAKMEATLASLPVSKTTLNYLETLTRDVHILVIAEDWCGDVHRQVPILEAVARSSPKIHVRYITRMDRPDVFARFLTNGGEAIPKFIFLSDNFVECGNWGPMPDVCRRIIARGKAAGDVASARKKTAALFEADPQGEETVRELLALIDIAVAVKTEG